FFSYSLVTIENNEISPWQIGFYDKAADKITTFVIEKDEIAVQKEEDVFKKPGMEVKPIEMEKAKLKFDEIIKKAEKFKKEEYPKEAISKTIAILQNIEDYGTIWNITFVTDSFKTLNMKINPQNGEIMHHNLDSLMSFVKK
ncbi:MAG: hypothetical protein AABX74_05565, partial [Nanoarchaeota archaeon]